VRGLPHDRHQERWIMNDANRSSPSSPGASDQPAGRQPSGVPMSPGDEAPEGTPGTGLNVCPRCGGSGQADDGECPECEGTGQVNVGIGGA
jgi:hypothetical protein